MQISGGPKYLPPRQDVNAPALYIPFMAVSPYCLLASVARALAGTWSPDSMYGTVRARDVCCLFLSSLLLSS